ncbi:unnamed protein product [Symbiodinium sp. CCMP2592]|nr:unnamed protein product [Symbiodinium sp. CCMP2592]
MSTAPVTKGAIEKMNKGQLQEHLGKLGEECPTQWGKAEIKARICELVEELGQEIPSGRTRPPLATMMTEMNKGSRKKADLAIRKIYDLSPATGMDPVGFGRHASLSYEEIMKEWPEYCQWVLQTAHENGKESDYRLQRLAGWLRNQPTKEKSYPTTKAKARSPATRSPYPATSSGSHEDQSEKIRQLTEAMEIMKAEMAALVPEPRRKKAEASKSEDEGISPDSFSMVSESGKGRGHKKP